MTLFRTTPTQTITFHLRLKWLLGSNIMHQSIPPAPSSPHPHTGYCGAFARLVSPGGGALANFALPGGWAFANPPAKPLQLHRGFYWKNKQVGWFFKEGKKLTRFVKACSRFYACISSLLIKPELHSETRNQHFFGYWIKFLLILFEEHPFIFIKLFIAVNFTAHY